MWSYVCVYMWVCVTLLKQKCISPILSPACLRVNACVCNTFLGVWTVVKVFVLHMYCILLSYRAQVTYTRSKIRGMTEEPFEKRKHGDKVKCIWWYLIRNHGIKTQNGIQSYLLCSLYLYRKRRKNLCHDKRYLERFFLTIISLYVLSFKL